MSSVAKDVINFVGYDNFQLIVLVVLFLSLAFTFYFLHTGTEDDRRRKRRITFTAFKRSSDKLSEKIKVEKYDDAFRQMGIHKYVNSVRLNLVRLGAATFLIVIKTFELVLQTQIIDLIAFISLAAIPVFLVPTKFSPLFYITNYLTKRHQYKKKMEVYQLFQDIVAEYESRQENVGNIFHLMKNLKRYYPIIRPEIEKMLPLLSEGAYTDAWEKFGKDVGVYQAERLGNVMKNVESLPFKNVLKSLENERSEFANSILASYIEYLEKRKNILWVVVFAGAIFVCINPISAFQMWYKDIMGNANDLMIGGG